jgi:hypothetical protein
MLKDPSGSFCYDTSMSIRFTYLPEMESLPLKIGLGGLNNSGRTDLAQKALAAQIDPTDSQAVAKFALNLAADSGIAMESDVARIEASWRRVEEEAIAGLGKMFDTAWQPGELVAYLTLSTRCPYEFPSHFWIYQATTSPVRGCLHELQHFYAHQLILPVFEKAARVDRFNDFKEALTALLNIDFADIMEKPDEGYPRHQELRQKLAEEYRAGVSISDMATKYLAG